MIHFAAPKYAARDTVTLVPQPVGRNRLNPDLVMPTVQVAAPADTLGEDRLTVIVKHRRYGPSLLVLGSPTSVTSPH